MFFYTLSTHHSILEFVNVNEYKRPNGTQYKHEKKEKHTTFNYVKIPIDTKDVGLVLQRMG